MNFRIADTFVDSLEKLNAAEKKLVKNTAFDLQMNPSHPGMKFHRIEKTKDKGFWSIRVNRDIRVIVHKSKNNLLLCYTDHHDNAYQWARRRRLEAHPRTGAAQMVVIKECIREVTTPKVTAASPTATYEQPPLFADRAEEELLGYGVPADWLEDVKTADEDRLLDIAEYLPAEAAEALLRLAVGETPAPVDSIPPVEEAETTDAEGSPSAAPGAKVFFKTPSGISLDAFDHPDARRRFRVMDNQAELEQALDYPWEKWAVFLHPAQKHAVERTYSGPARVSGSAGTGKTIVALHRAVHLLRTRPDARVALLTFSPVLAYSLKQKIRRLIANAPRLAERLEVADMNSFGERLYAGRLGIFEIIAPSELSEFMEAASTAAPDHSFSPEFLLAEWKDIIDARRVDSRDAYRKISRAGRKIRLNASHRDALWDVFEKVKNRLQAENKITRADLFHRLADELAASTDRPCDHIIVDEAQDITAAQLRFLSVLGADRPEALFFAGDLGQRIFQSPFSWKSAGVEIRGRSRTLTINYRTSHQIRRRADLLLASVISDIDGNAEKRKGTVSVFNGPTPVLREADSPEEEQEIVADWLRKRLEENVLPHEIGVFVRSPEELDRASAAVTAAGATAHYLDDTPRAERDKIAVSIMHYAKGLEFKAVAVMACDDEVIPSQKRMETVTEEADLEEIYHTERHLLYVAVTRARDHLLVTGVDPVSEFMEDLMTDGSL